MSTQGVSEKEEVLVGGRNRLGQVVVVLTFCQSKSESSLCQDALAATFWQPRLLAIGKTRRRRRKE